jgi:hypothetical protein
MSTLEDMSKANGESRVCISGTGKRLILKDLTGGKIPVKEGSSDQE